MRVQWRRVVAMAAVGAALSLAGGSRADAQDLTSADNGRYQLLSSAIGPEGKKTSVTLMVDTQSGRSWMLMPDNQFGGHWQRMPLVRMDSAPEGMLTRPLPVTQQSPAR